MPGLTHKQRLFVEHYLVCWSATEAARRAGYKVPRISGSRNKHKPEIAAAIKARLAEVAMSADEVLLRLAEQARGSLEEFLHFVAVDAHGDEIALDAQGQPKAKPARFVAVIDLNKAREAQKLRLLHALKHTKYGWEIELYDAQRALELIGKHHGLFAGDRPAVTVNFNLDEWQRQREERRKQLDELAEPDECAATDGES